MFLLPLIAPARARVLVTALLLLGIETIGLAADQAGPADRLPVPVLVEMAEAEFARGQTSEARELLARAMTRDPHHPAVLQAVRHHWPMLAGTITDQDAALIARDSHLAEARRLQALANEAEQSGALEAALQYLRAADVLLRPTIAASETPEQNARSRRMAALQAAIDREHQLTQDETRRTNLRHAQDRSQVAPRTDQSRLSERQRRIELLEEKALYELALSHARTLIQDHPDHAEVRRLYARILAKAHAARDLSISESNAELLQETQERLERSLVPTTGYAGLFPEDWHTRHTAPPDLVALPDTTASDRTQEQLLARMSLNVVDMDVTDVLKAISSSHHLNIVIAPELQRDPPRVSLKAADMSVRSILDWMAHQTKAQWEIVNGAIYVGGETTDLPTLRTYDISESSFPISDQVPRYRIGILGPDNQPADPDAGQSIIPEDLVDALTQAVSPGTWQRADCGIQIRWNRLLVTAPVQVHRLVDEFLRSQMTQSRLMVRVEAKWLQHDDSFFEEIGVNWNGGGPLLSQPNGATYGLHRATSQFDLSGSLTNSLPAAATATPAPTAGLTLSSMLLSSLQLSATLKAVEGNHRATLVNASYLHTPSGVRANSIFMRTFYYLGGLEFEGSIGGGFSSPAAPSLAALLLGTQLDVKPFVSADRKYVTLDVAASRLTLLDVNAEGVAYQTSLPVGTQPDPNNPGGPPIPIVVPGTSTARVELPRTQFTEVRTTVMIPDGGSILVAGIAEETEQTTSAKIPFLGHIPFLGRLFGERGRYSSRKKLSLIFTVHILDLAELEQQQ